MKRLYAPWRKNYTKSRQSSKSLQTTQEECVFCIQQSETKDKDNFIIKRYCHVFVMLNRYPYNAGHIMVLPNDHIDRLPNLSKECRQELMEVTSLGTAILENVLGCQGINVGLNVGKASGAGIPAHLHMHLVPRWPGDTNFMTIIANTKVISIDMHEVYSLLKDAFDTA